MSRRHHCYDLSLEAAATQGYAEGQIAERERVREILSSPEAVGREGAAIFIATRTDLPARAALAVLATAPRGASPSYGVRPLRFPTIHVIFDNNEGTQ